LSVKAALRIGAADGLDAGGGAAQRSFGHRPDDEARLDRRAAVEPDRDAAIAGSIATTAAAIAGGTGKSAARWASAAIRWRFAMLWPKAGRPISAASNSTSGAAD